MAISWEPWDGPEQYLIKDCFKFGSKLWLWSYSQPVRLTLSTQGKLIYFP